jgi:serine/threonine-protein kinase HipA
VIATARKTVTRFREVWAAEKGHLPMSPDVPTAIDAHLPRVPIANE